ncbi:MAG: hypothetical protein MRERC_3c099 [Mycoplasmataceae bacterium RC_NB112A]|nr:MAG: hypothetical protein MRERC_12c041 [Mycoplasmataceae bacterium RC_NB112A]KLL02252.1 MAG: hypothetical protein MRERC_3c099 [Mycoplasmataceae bacterium RC_NB112A]
MRTKKFRSKKSFQKRFKISAKGSLKCRHAGAAHLASRKTNHQKKRLHKPFVLNQSDVSRLKKLMGPKLSKKMNNYLPNLIQKETLAPKII